MLLEVWSDMVCPWCYVGKRRLETALERFERRDEVEVVWRSFELDPLAHRDPERPLIEVLAQKYGGGRAGAQAMIDRVTAVAAGEGLRYRLDLATRGSSFDAHRLAHWARTLGRQEAFVERCMQAYFGEGARLGAAATLVALAADAGLDPEAAAEVLAGTAYADQVRADQELAAGFGIGGVPCFVLDRRLAVSGAQPTELLSELLQRGPATQGTSPAGASR